MLCRDEGPLKSKFPVKMKSYFVWFTCAINFVTICSVIVQLLIQNGGMAMTLDKSSQSENENLDEISQMDVMYRKDDISLYVL